LFALADAFEGKHHIKGAEKNLVYVNTEKMLNEEVEEYNPKKFLKHSGSVKNLKEEGCATVYFSDYVRTVVTNCPTEKKDAMMYDERNYQTI
jgi:hypothetical protein